MLLEDLLNFDRVSPRSAELLDANPDPEALLKT
jgi:hypothetical protein